MVSQEQTQLNIREQLQTLLCSGTWRDCQIKQHNIFAILPPPGFIFANKFIQAQAYGYLMHTFKKPIVYREEISKKVLSQLGHYYETDGRQIVICGTQGELEQITPAKFLSTYVMSDGRSKPDKPPVTWKEYIRPAETRPVAQGRQIPVEYLGVYASNTGVQYMNDPRLNSHYKGDILVVSSDGQVKLVNNKAFAAMYNQTVGGWAQSKGITPQAELKQMTLSQVTAAYKFIRMEQTSRPELKPHMEIFNSNFDADNLIAKIEKAQPAVIDCKTSSVSKLANYNDYTFVIISSGTYNIISAVISQMMKRGDKRYDGLFTGNIDGHKFICAPKAVWPTPWHLTSDLKEKIIELTKEEIGDAFFSNAWCMTNYRPLYWVKDDGFKDYESTVACAMLAHNQLSV